MVTMKPIKGQYRQGDVLITPTKEVLDAVLAEGSHVLAEGESTGHAHRFLGPKVAFLRDDGRGGGHAVSGAGGASVVHEEHDTIVIEPNVRKTVRRQVQYTPQAIRHVAD
jgi:hypothetical protein